MDPLSPAPLRGFFCGRALRNQLVVGRPIGLAAAPPPLCYSTRGFARSGKPSLATRPRPPAGLFLASRRDCLNCCELRAAATTCDVVCRRLAGASVAARMACADLGWVLERFCVLAGSGQSLRQRMGELRRGLRQNYAAGMVLRRRHQPRRPPLAKISHRHNSRE